MEILRTDVCVIGGGSGGFGAALAAARIGVDVILVEKNHILGGTSTVAWVHNWEPSSGGGGIPKDLWEVMIKDPLASPTRDYKKGDRHGGTPLVWEPRSFVLATTKMLSETGRCRILFGTTFYDVVMNGGKIESILCVFAGTLIKIEALIFIDCTADGNVCVASGCEYRIGEDSKSSFNEPNALENPEMRLNALTLMYRITDTGKNQKPFLPEGFEPCRKSAALRTCANGDILVNVMDMIQGNAICSTDLSKMLRTAIGLVHAHFYYMQTEKGYEKWTISGVASEIGVRETRRIIGEYVLNENDLLMGVKKQERCLKHHDIITITDHPIDIHGNPGYHKKLYKSYGVPYRCLLPKNTENLMIACRAASLSHIAASSCRLSRTMMTLGQAVGTAAAMAICCNKKIREIDICALRKKLLEDGVELWDEVVAFDNFECKKLKKEEFYGIEEFKEGIKVFSDRDHIFKNIPTKYNGATYIRCPVKSVKKTDVNITVEFHTPSSLYILWCKDVAPADWLNKDYDKTEDEVVWGPEGGTNYTFTPWKSKNPGCEFHTFTSGNNCAYGMFAFPLCVSSELESK